MRDRGFRDKKQWPTCSSPGYISHVTEMHSQIRDATSV